MEPIRKIIHPRITGPVDLQLILNTTVSVKVKLQLIQKICDALEECCRHQNYFDNMIFVLLKLLSNTDPAFSPENDIFKLRKLVLQILHKVCSSNDKIKNHVQITMEACLKVIETDNEQCVIYCILIFKELLTALKPKFDGCFKTEIFKFLKLIMDMYSNSNTQEKIFSYQKTNDLKVLITTIRITTTISKNSVNYVFIPMGKVSLKVLKELANMLKLYYLLFYNVQSFKHEIIEFFPILMNFFNMDIPYKPDYRDIVLDLKHAQIRLLFFFAIFLKDNKDAATRLHCTTLPSRIISLLSCNISSDVSNLRTELLSGFESVILIDYKCEFLPLMDKFLDETLITGKSWSLKSVLRPKAYIYIDHLITHLHNQLSLNFLVRAIHLHLSNILDPTLQPEVQINLCNMVMNILSYIVHRQNQSITNINTTGKNSPLIDLLYRVFQIFVKKLKQFQKLYLPQLDEKSFAQENIKESISSILAEYKSKVTQNEFMYGYHSSQLPLYTLEDSKRFIKIIIPAIRTLFQFIVNIERGKFSVEYQYEHTFNNFLKYALLSLKVYNCPINKKEMVKELLIALSCIKPIHLQTLIVGSNLISQIYNNNLEIFVFDIALNDETLASTFSCLIFEFILKNISNENEKSCLFDLINRLQMHLKLNSNEEITNQYIYRVIKMLMINLKHSKYPVIHLGMLKKILIIMESAKYDFDDIINAVLRCLLSDLLSYHQSLPNNLVVTKNAIAELCLTEGLFKVLLCSQMMDLLSLIKYSLQFTELTLQGLSILEKCIDIIPVSLFDDPILEVQNEIVNGLCFCMNSPIKSISQSAVKLLGRLGGFSRSSTIKPGHFNVHEQNCQISENPKIFISFEDYTNQFIGINVDPGLSIAVEKLISNHDRFIRAHCWNVVKGFLLVAVDCDTTGITTLVPANINLNTYVDVFSNSELQYVRTKTDETYIKALTGLMVCCTDENLKNDSYKYLNEFIKVIVSVSLNHFCGISFKSPLKVSPYVLIDAITKVLSNERETISDTGKIATLLLMDELHKIFKDSMLHFPLMEYMFRQFCELCYNSSWICKRAGCSGLHILFNLLTEDTMKEQFSNWFMEHFVTAFKAMMFIFSDFNKHLTFGAMEIASNNLDVIFNWLFWIKPMWSITSFNLIQTTTLKNLLDYIIGSNDLLREQSIKIIDLMAIQQKLTVSYILKPYFKYLKKLIPGKRFFNTYTFKSQLGIMKAHIFCALHCIPVKQLDFSNKKHTYYFNFLCNLCENNNERTKKKKCKNFTFHQVHEFHLTAIQVLANCQQFLTRSNKLKVFKILLNTLKNPNEELQEMAYHCLQSCNSKLTTKQVAMVDKLLSCSANLLLINAKVTQGNIRHTLYLSKLYPTHFNPKFCTILVNLFKYFWDNLHHCKNKTSRNKLQHSLKDILETICIISETQFFHIKSLSEIILNEDISNINRRDKLYTLLSEGLLKFPNEFLNLFFQEQYLINSVWCSFFNSIIRNKKYELFRNLITSDSSRLENLLTAARVDQSKTVQYEIIRIIHNLVKMDTKWITTKKKLIGVLLNTWANPQYKEQYKNLANIKSTEWDEPKMLLKIVLEYFKANAHEVCILFQILPVFSYKFPFDTNIFRNFLENDVIKSYTIQWKRMVFIKFVELYQKKGVNSDILGKVLQYIILPCFSLCYKNGEKEKLLCTYTKSNDNIIGIILTKMLTNIRVVLTGCDIDGIKVSLCQLICLLIEDLLLFDEGICDIIYNSVISCTWVRCTMDVNVKFHCYLILTSIMLSGNASRREKLNQGIYYELLKASFAEAQPVINHSLNLIVSAVCRKENELNNDINTLVVCIRKIMMTESQNVPTLHHICSFLIKYHTLFYPYKQFLIRNILGSLFPIAKNNNVPEFKKTAIELSCMIINWELTDDEENMKLKFPLKRKTYDASPASANKKKSSETIDNCLNFLAMVGCQTHDDKPESRISKLAVRSATLFKHILSTEPIESKEVKLKFGWIEKLLDTFLKKENMIKQNPNAHGNTNANLMNLLTTFDIISFMLNVLSQKLMLEALKPLQEHLMKFLQLAYDEEDTLNDFYNYLCLKDNSIINRLSDKQIKQYNEGTIKFVSNILKTFPTNDGLEKLHLFIQMIISEGLNSNYSHKLGISLTLLKVSLKHFPNYIDNEVLNTMGDIMFKFNENNSNPLIKVKCLDILKTHVDKLPRVGKQVFFEKIIIENLNKAIDLENKIPFDVQIKCFQLIITYIHDLPEATEGILLNSTLMQYIITTTDEQIMIAILNLITKWIEVCRDEAVFFNCQIIDILKYITALNRFPKFSDYCYQLNLEIYKNWHFCECIKYGLDCKNPAIRSEFINFHNSLWRGDNGLCSRLFTILSDELSYDLDFSLAFYLQLLLVNISKNTKLIGDFSLFDTEQLIENNKTPTTTKNFSSSVKRILSYDMCSSLVQLCFVDENLAKTLWISILPSIWDLFDEIQKNSLSAKSVHFLTNSKLKNNFMTAFFEALVLCKPKINFEPHQLVYIGKTYNLWYETINQIEDTYNHFEHNEKSDAIYELIQMYAFLREEDIIEGLFQIMLSCDYTKIALSLEQRGDFKKASQMYIELLDYEENHTKVNLNNFYNKEKEFKKIHLTKCLRELNEWDILSKHVLTENDFMLNIESVWKKSIENSTSYNLKWYLKKKQKIWPSTLNWMYHFYMGMLNLNKINEKVMSTVQKHIEHSFEEITNNWKLLPKYLCSAHIPLLQATQLIVEMQEACDVQNSWLLTLRSTDGIDSLINVWNKRKPWIGDDLSVWNNLISWRQTFYSFLIPRGLSSPVLNNQSKLVFAEVALKQNVIDVCMNTLKSIVPDDNTSNLLYKMYLEAKCIQKNKNYSTKFNSSIHTPLNEDFTKITNSLLLLIRGSFQDYSGNSDMAFKYFTMAFLNQSCTDPSNTDWQCIIENNFNRLCHNIYKCDIDNQIPSLNNHLTILNSNEILKNGWIQWAKLIQNKLNQPSVENINIALAAMKCYVIASKLTSNINCNIIVSKILWLLTYNDDNSCSLLRTFEKSNITFSDLWIPQILNIFVEKNKSTIKKIVLKIGKLCPQKVYLILNRMYLTEKMNYMKESLSVDEESDVKKFVTTKNKKMYKIKQIIKFLQKCKVGIIHILEHFVNQIIALGESRDEEIRRNLYECLYLCYDCAFESKNINTSTPKQITVFIENIFILFVEHVNSDCSEMKKPFSTYDSLAQYYEFLMEKYLIDFSIDKVYSINLMIQQLKKWIKYFENKSNYPSRFRRKLHCSSINNFDWSMIKLPSANYDNDTSCAVRIHNLSSHIYVKDKVGTIVKQITIRGTNGLLYTYNISRGQDIESEERILQLFHIANNYLLNFKETAKRFLKLFILRTFVIAPHVCMIETNSSVLSLFDIYKEINATGWVNEDIEYWFSVLNSSVIIERTEPLKESLFSTTKQFNSGDVMKNWALTKYPTHSDYWTFRKTFIEHYSVLCSFEYAFNLIKVKPEMLNIYQNNGVAVVLMYKFLSNKNQGKSIQSHSVPFRLTPSLSNFITPYRKYQIINCLIATGQCLYNSIEDITSVVKLLLKDEFKTSCNTPNSNKTMLKNNNQIIEIVNKNLDCIIKNLENLKQFSMQNPAHDLVLQALHDDYLCHESPTWRPWL